MGNKEMTGKNACSHLHRFRTLEADTKVRPMATDLQALLAEIEGGDLDANYHFACLTQLHQF